MIRKLVVAGVVLTVLAVGSNTVLEGIAEPRLDEAAAAALGLEGGVDVDIQSFPLVLDIFRGRVDAIEVRVEGRRFEDLTIRSIVARLEGVTIEGSVFGGGPDAIVVERVQLAVVTDEDAINAFLRRRGHDARVRLLDGEIDVVARRSVFGSTRTFRARGPLTIEERDLVFRPRDVSWDGPTFPGAEDAARRATTIREPLPELPGNIRPSAIVVNEGEVRMAAAGEGRRFPLR